MVLDSNGTKIVAIIVESSGDCSVINGLAGTKVDADKVLKAPDGVSTLVTKEGTKTTINLSGRVEEGIPSDLGTVFSGGTNAGITTVTLKGLVPTDDSTVTITQVNKAMNAYYGAGQSPMIRSLKNTARLITVGRAMAITPSWSKKARLLL